MGNGELPEPQYEGEDVRPTSQKELSGWYSYGFAAEVFVICAMGVWLLFETYQGRGH